MQYLTELTSGRATVIDHFLTSDVGGQLQLSSLVHFGNSVNQRYDYPIDNFMLRIVYDPTNVPNIRLFFALGDDLQLPDSAWTYDYWASTALNTDSIFYRGRQRMIAILWSVRRRSFH